ncbi:Integrin alpha beta-propellor repeat-containing protein [Carpediemonas membranifera]|uniref:Integrin alpha beta-propellor repeat-containing protein n=1 Tax=Carpediemonas membranifera TaxID=201153 RepID=A0A8J6ASI9_9EUKA|nr:Integrin alpha beta-propellor repeat-containing protein [Carpediemonas membranifera]|eukprot:KAG9390405.1 Integrin alpha beta-propellor repeat-containing protein [Carpediemonas membranifera]
MMNRWWGILLVIHAVTAVHLYQQTLFADQNDTNLDFGHAVRLKGSVAAVGSVFALFAKELDKPVGSVTVLERIGTEWSLQALLFPMIEMPAFFGHSLGLDEDWLIVGCPGNNSQTGYAAAYARSASSVDFFQFLLPTHNEAWRFGLSVDIHNGSVAVGIPGQFSGAGGVQMFEWADNQWGVGTLLTSAPEVGGAQMGTVVAMHDGWLFAGAPAPSSYKGSVSVYRRVVMNDQPAWQFRNMITATANTHSYGRSLACDAGLLAVGFISERERDTGEFVDIGAVNLYYYSDDGLTIVQKLEAASTVEHVGFGRAIATLGSVIVVGDTSDKTSGVGTGAALVYRYDAETSQFVFEAPVFPINSVAGMTGSSVAVSDRLVATGAPATMSHAGIVYTVAADCVVGDPPLAWDQCAPHQPGPAVAGGTSQVRWGLVGAVVAVVVGAVLVCGCCSGGAVIAAVVAVAQIVGDPYREPLAWK